MSCADGGGGEAGGQLTEPRSTGAQVNGMMRQLEQGRLQDAGMGPELHDGWEARLPSGGTVFRSQLLAAARQLAALGPEAVPALADWADHANAAIRFAAIAALQQITGHVLQVPYFDDSDQSGARARAIGAWRDWYNHRGQ